MKMGFNVSESYCWVLSFKYPGDNYFDMSTLGDYLITDCLSVEYIDEWYNALGRYAINAKGY